MAYIDTLDHVPRVLLIQNPAAGQLQLKTNMYDIVSIFAKKGCVPTTLITSKQGDAAEFVKRYADTHDIVVCCGGDGTLNETITGMMPLERRIPIGFIPCGTTNDMARTLGVPTGNVKKAAHAILDGYNVHQDVGRFCRDNAENQRFFTYVASFGAFTKVSYATPRWKKHIFGHMAYIMDAIPAISEIRPIKLRVQCDQLDEEGEFAFGSITNSTSIAGVLRLDGEKVSLNDGKFEVMLIRHPKTAADLHKIVEALTQQKFVAPNADKERPMVEFFHTDRITVTSETPISWTLDGEFGGDCRIAKIKNLHGAVEILKK